MMGFIIIQSVLLIRPLAKSDKKQHFTCFSLEIQISRSDKKFNYYFLTL